MSLTDELKEAMDRLDIRGSQHVDSLIDALEDEEFAEDGVEEDDEDQD